jgi:hypothetical protein
MTYTRIDPSEEFNIEEHAISKDEQKLISDLRELLRNKVAEYKEHENDEVR